MGDPERLLSAASDSDDLERELLGSLRDVSPPGGAKNAAWNGIVAAAAIGTIGVAASLAEGASAAAEVAKTGVATSVGGALQAPTAAIGVAAKALTAKVVLGVALAGSTVAAGSWWANHRTSPRASMAVSAPHLSNPSSSEPKGFSEAAPTAPDAPVAHPADPLAGSRSSGRDTSPKVDDARSRNGLGIESAMLTEARGQLRSGDAAAAWATLERLQARHPKGLLGQEREVLSIQVLAALGNTDAASRRARAFLDRYPSSPHAPQLSHFWGP